MSDNDGNLRTRIAAAMSAEVERNGLDSPVEDWIPFLADAVIRELQLTVLGDGIVVGVIHE